MRGRDAFRRGWRLVACLFGAGLLASGQMAIAQAPSAGADASLPAAASSLAETYGRLPFVERPDLSPDGTRMVGLFNVGGRQQIRILSLFDPAEKVTGFGIPEQTEIAWLRWINNDVVLVGLVGLRPVEGDRWYIDRMVSIDRKTGKVTKLLWDMGGQNASDVAWLPHDGGSQFLVAAQNSIYLGEDFWPAVYRVDALTGKKALVQRGVTGINNWYTDSAGMVRSGVAYDSGARRFRLIYRPETGGSFSTIDRAQATKDESLLQPLVFLPGTNRALVLHEDDKGRSGLFEVDLLSQQEIRPVYLAEPGVEIEGLSLAEDGKAVLGVYTSSSTEPVHWLDPALAELQALFAKATPGARVSIVSLSSDRQRMLVRVAHGSSPGAYYYYSTAGGRCSASQ